MATPLRVHKRLNKGYGWKPGLPQIKHPLYRARVEAEALPPHVDLRPGCPPVYDQGQLGSCTGNGWAGVAEFLLLKQGVTEYVPSRLFIYYNERVIEGEVSEDAGASIANGASVVSSEGCPHETLWPYNIAKFADKPAAAVYSDGLQHLLMQVQQVHQDLTSMREVLASGLPIVIGFTVYESFESDKVTQSGIVPMPGHHEQVVGGHCVVLVGYDDSQKRFIVRNSWGDQWGQKGYFTMPYAYLTNARLASDFWMATSIAAPSSS